MSASWASNGDMILRSSEADAREVRFRRVGWIIYGGSNDGRLVPEMLPEYRAVPHGSFAPVYVEIGDG